VRSRLRWHYPNPLQRRILDANDLLYQVAASLLADLGSEHRTKPGPPEPHRLVTNVDDASSQ
jgi:HEAT repeat protein